MKRLLVTALVVVMSLALPVWAEGDKDDPKPDKAKCPENTMQSDCLTCHIAGKVAGKKFAVKESAPDAWRVYPNSAMKVIDDGPYEKRGYILVGEINSDPIKEFFDYLDRHKIKKATIEFHSPGGNLFDAQRIVGLIRYQQSKGMTIETRIFGAGFSAAFYIFTAGDLRLVDEFAELMWHELQTPAGGAFKLATPSDTEEKARVERRFQSIRNTYLATRGKLSKEEIDKKIAKREFWMSGKQAVEFGFADGFIGK